MGIVSTVSYGAASGLVPNKPTKEDPKKIDSLKAPPVSSGTERSEDAATVKLTAEQEVAAENKRAVATKPEVDQLVAELWQRVNSDREKAIDAFKGIDPNVAQALTRTE